jgi:hypothetical protein
VLRGVIILAVIAVALLRGGSLLNFAAVRLRALPLVFAGFGLQLAIFPLFTEQPLIPVATTAIYLLSMALLVGWAVLNRAVPGMPLVVAGVVMNTAAIAMNGGYMPVDPQAAEYAGRLARYAADGAPVLNNSLATAEEVRLWLLTDIFPVPAGIPLANVFSLGDILLTTGIGVFCYRVIRGGEGATPTATAPVAAGPAPS